jgi:RNA polymerase sigma-70 factor (ECF subfamily)
VKETRTGEQEETPQPHSDLLDLQLARARRGEEAAFRTLYRALTPELLRYSAVITGQDAEDVVADTWLQISRDLHRFRGDGAAFRRFALAVTRNRARDLLRRRRRRVQETSLPPAELPDHGLPGQTAQHHSRDAAEIVGSRLSEQEAVAVIRRLPRAQAEAVLLRVVLDMDNRSAAEVLGRRPGAVATALSRGLRQLAKLAREDGFGEEVRTRCETGCGPSTRQNSDG